jgi:hypothetical protein
LLDFDPKYTEVVFLDTECYVPPEDRVEGPSSMIVNPANPKHILLGGVFVREFPLQKRSEDFEQIWSWTREDEKNTLRRIYDFFQKSWKLIEGKSKDHPDLIVIGTGVSRFDIPMLFVKSLLNEIDSPEKLYETFFKTKIVDLGDVGIGLFPLTQDFPVIYPKTTNAIATRLGVPVRKTSGKSVWDMYDGGEFEGIKERTLEEVKMIRSIATRIVRSRT